MKKLLMLVFLLLTVNVSAKIPYTLYNGRIIDARQLNANFKYLLDKNYYKLFPIRANGKIIGKAIIVSGTVLSSFNFNSDFTVTTLRKDGTVPQSCIVYFKQPNCSIEGGIYIRYINDFNEKTFSFPPLKGGICEYKSKLYYYPPNSQLVKIIPESRAFPNCYLPSPSDSNPAYIKLLPNDPSVTGIETYPFPTPITVDGVMESTIIED